VTASSQEVIFIPTKTFENLPKEKQDRIINASITEFSKRSFDDSKLSNIIKESKIPRGSFYQYFIDKRDLYLYIMEVTKNIKMKYMEDAFSEAGQIPFLDLFRKLFVSGIEFALEHEDLVSMGKILITSKGSIYDEVMKDGLALAEEMYINFIEIDKKKDIIRQDVDSKVLASLVVGLSNNILIDSFKDTDANFENLLIRIDSLINIFRKGIE